MLFNCQKSNTIYKFFNDLILAFTDEWLQLRGFRLCYQSEKTSKRKQKVQNIDIDVLVLKKQSDWWMAQDCQNQNSVNKRGICFVKKKYCHGVSASVRNKWECTLSLPTTKLAIFTSLVSKLFLDWMIRVISSLFPLCSQDSDRIGMIIEWPHTVGF